MLVSTWSSDLMEWSGDANIKLDFVKTGGICG